MVFFLNRYDSNGGIISIDYLDSKNYILKSLFISCRSNLGGSIYINLPLFVQIEENCFENCSAKNHGQCIYCLNKNFGSLFELNFCLIKKCPDQFLGVSSGFYIRYSDAIFNNINYTNSKFTGYDIIYISNGLYSEIKYLNSINIWNSIILDFAESSNAFSFKSNIVNSTFNNHLYYNVLIFDSNSINITIKEFIFISNYFSLLSSHSKTNFIFCIFFDCSFMSNNVQLYPITYDNLQLTNCLFYDFTYFYPISRNLLRIPLFFCFFCLVY